MAVPIMNMSDIPFEGIIWKNSLYLPKAAESFVGSEPHVFATNADLEGLNVLLLHSRESFRKTYNRIITDCYSRFPDENPTPVVRRLSGEMTELARRRDDGQDIIALRLEDRISERFGASGRIYLVPDNDRLVAVKLSDLGNYYVGRVMHDFNHFVLPKIRQFITPAKAG